MDGRKEAAFSNFVGVVWTLYVILCLFVFKVESLRLVPATSPLKSLREGTGRRDLSHKQFTRSVLRNKPRRGDLSQKFKLV